MLKVNMNTAIDWWSRIKEQSFGGKSLGSFKFYLFMNQTFFCLTQKFLYIVVFNQRGHLVETINVNKKTNKLEIKNET